MSYTILSPLKNYLTVSMRLLNSTGKMVDLSILDRIRRYRDSEKRLCRFTFHGRSCYKKSLAPSDCRRRSSGSSFAMYLSDSLGCSTRLPPKFTSSSKVGRDVTSGLHTRRFCQDANNRRKQCRESIPGRGLWFPRVTDTPDRRRNCQNKTTDPMDSEQNIDGRET